MSVIGKPRSGTGRHPSSHGDAKVGRTVVGVVDLSMATSPLRVVRDRITRTELLELAESQFGDMVKAVVDVERGVMVVGGELHSD